MEAVLFDFDGVIANTLPYHAAAWSQAFGKYQITVQPGDISRHEGKGALQIAAGIAEKYGLSCDEAELEEITAQKRSIYKQTTRAGVYPETEQFIAQLKRNNIRMALVTGSIMQSMLSVVDEAFLSQFDVIVTQHDVEHTKPHPEPFLKAAEKLGVPPSECIVIENAPMGIEAARAAGMVCVALRTTIQDDNMLKNADLIVDNASQINLSLPLFGF